MQICGVTTSESLEIRWERLQKYKYYGKLSTEQWVRQFLHSIIPNTALRHFRWYQFSQQPKTPYLYITVVFEPTLSRITRKLLFLFRLPILISVSSGSFHINFLSLRANTPGRHQLELMPHDDFWHVIKSVARSREIIKRWSIKVSEVLVIC